MKVKFHKWDCQVTFRKYGNGRTAIELIETKEPFESVAIASVNLPNEPMEEDEIAIKSYSENEGMLECLVKYKVVSKPVRIVQSGFVSIAVCKLLIKQ